MKFLDKLKDIFNKIFKRNDIDLSDFLPEEKNIKQLPIPELQKEETYEPIQFPEGEIVSFNDEVLDTDSKVSKEKFNHNLEILINKAKETGKVDKFMLIREDDFFPTDWEWRVLSKNTNLEKVCTPLSYELKKAYALEQNGIDLYREIMGVKVPNASYDETMQALLQIDKTLGSVLLPSRFRSTKHFTINTPLGFTTGYNNVETNRDYIIIDDISKFLESEYGYSVSYRDAYLDISHESLPISQEAVVLINDENYERIMSDEKVASELSQRKIIRFKGDENVAINMILTQMGALPSKMGTKYDKELYDILDKSIRNLAEENGLFFDKSHGGALELDKGHFSNYYDEKNEDYEKSVKEFIAFLRQKFPEQEELFPEYLRLTENTSMKIVEKLGTTNLLEAISEYNELASNKVKQTFEEYKQDRKNITPEIHKQFVETIALINNFYKSKTNYESYEEKMQTENTIQKFLQGETVKEQLEAAKSVWELLPKNINRTETTVGDGTITMEQIVSNAITKGISTEYVAESDNIEFREVQNRKREGEIIGEQ